MKHREIAKKLGIKLDFGDLEKKGEDFALHQLKRRIRYYCYAMKRKTEDENDKVRVPKRFIEFFESLSMFEGWSAFSVTWDVSSDQPDTIYPRNFSVEEEWNATLRRVVPELPVDRVWRQKNGTKGNI